MLVFEKSRAGRGMSMLPACDVEIKKPGEKDARQKELHLPQMSENDLSRHYTEWSQWWILSTWILYDEVQSEN